MTESILANPSKAQDEVSARTFLKISEANPKDVAELSEKNFLKKQK